ncbi:angiogenic factor with G patch and FHA domains 1 isoform X3 [Neodiprion virginianus]|uniref:angiogenic factor with G patch and FHA domains 1 isoform X3 n=1 Tax=Neodiprion virginianus TaxID=2961670 RepID=UPI001EE72666|nr:angiogenic factor with G patch and FHA domains 1 isoform X3 [Neodiprion virginianus]
MEVCQRNDSDDVTSILDEDYQDVLKDLPQVLDFIRKLQNHIRWQKKKINKLRNKLNGCKKGKLQSAEKLLVDCATQTELRNADHNSATSQDWNLSKLENGENIVEQVTKAAESALQQTGFVYEETSGLYYDYNTGYYYDAEQGLYYDGNSGTYYCYDETSKTYKFHSQTQVSSSEVSVQKGEIVKKEKRKARKANKVSDEIHELITGLSNITIERSRQHALELTKTYPPCIRIIVKETSLPKLKPGSLFLVAYTGGSMGREGDHSVLIQDINISKQHARFQYDEINKRYEIIDLGSRNGTILNGKRLSVAKQESEPFEIVHGSIIQVGGTKLLCHIHNGHETCGHCEPGLVQQNVNAEGSTTKKQNQHKSELRRLKYKFGVEKNNVKTSSQVAAGYQDRAQARRVLVGSLNHHAKTQQSSVDVSIASDNKGFKLLSKMGWTEGQSLGKDGDGRIEPVPIVSNHNKAGLGASDAGMVPNLDSDPNTEKKQAMWKKTQQRYQEIPD